MSGVPFLPGVTRVTGALCRDVIRERINPYSNRCKTFANFKENERRRYIELHPDDPIIHQPDDDLESTQSTIHEATIHEVEDEELEDEELTTPRRNTPRRDSGNILPRGGHIPSVRQTSPSPEELRQNRMRQERDLAFSRQNNRINLLTGDKRKLEREKRQLNNKVSNLTTQKSRLKSENDDLKSELALRSRTSKTMEEWNDLVDDYDECQEELSRVKRRCDIDKDSLNSTIAELQRDLANCQRGYRLPRI